MSHRRLRRLSWLFSIAISLGFLLLTDWGLSLFFSDVTAARLNLVFLVLVIMAWMGVWRRYHAPLVNFIPKQDYDRFLHWQDEHGEK